MLGRHDPWAVPWRERSCHQTGNAGDVRRVHVYDVVLTFGDQAAEPEGPARVPFVRHPEACHVDAGFRERGHQGVLPRQQVGDIDFGDRPVAGAGHAHQQLLGASRAEALDEPQHTEPFHRVPNVAGAARSRR